MKEITIHYLVDLLKRTPSKDARHLEALEEMRKISDYCLDAHSLDVRFPILQTFTVTDLSKWG